MDFCKFRTNGSRPIVRENMLLNVLYFPCHGKRWNNDKLSRAAFDENATRVLTLL